MLLSVIIVNYNVQYFLEQALLSVRKASKGIDSEIIVVDNASTDNSVSMVQDKFPEAILIANRNNLGFSRANNQGILISKGRYVLLLNPDTIVREDTFRKCIDFMELHPDAGILGVKMIDGSGTFLPESKRGFPSPFVAFSKVFGLSGLFPKSRLFARYHLGYLDENQNHEIDVVAGAFMFLRKKALEKTGLLDESFFMYGEDIDLSFRIKKAGYTVNYFADTTIIHYKGESTRKGSINYILTFYNAMKIFARKHFSGSKATVFIALIYCAIYLRAFLALLTGFLQRFHVVLLDMLAIGSGLVLIKYLWASLYFHDPGYYEGTLVYWNHTIYLVIWLGTLFMSGGYDEPFNLRRLYKSLLLGTLIISALYAFLPLQLRPSRIIILLGTAWAIIATTLIRSTLHFYKKGNFNVGQLKPENLLIVGSINESQRVRDLLKQTNIPKNIIGTVSAEVGDKDDRYLASLDNLKDLARIFGAKEIIFCSKDISANEIMQWMANLGPDIKYRILPTDSISIIGSSSKNTAGELYTIEIKYQIVTQGAKRNKRLVDFVLAASALALSPIVVLFLKDRRNVLKTVVSVFIGKKSWTGYCLKFGEPQMLPKIKPGIFSPCDVFYETDFDEKMVQHVNFFYAKDYNMLEDVKIILVNCKRKITELF
jgi:GT2 family glycosyltransferase